MAYVCSDEYGNDFPSNTVLFEDKAKAKAWVKERREAYHQKYCIDRPAPDRCYCTMNPRDGRLCGYHDPKYNPPYDGHSVKECTEVKPGVFYEYNEIM